MNFTMKKEELTAKKLISAFKILSDKAPYFVGAQDNKEVGPIFFLEPVYNEAIDLLFPKVKKDGDNSFAFLVGDDQEEAFRTLKSLQLQDSIKASLPRYESHPNVVKALKIIGLALAKRKKIVKTIRRTNTADEVVIICMYLGEQPNLPTHAKMLSPLKNVTPSRLEA